MRISLMTEYEKLTKRIEELENKLIDCKDSDLICFYKNAVDGMRKKRDKLTLEKAGAYAGSNK